MKSLSDTAFNAESAQCDLPVGWAGVAISDEVSTSIDKRILRLQHVEVIRRANAKTDVTLKVSRLVFVTFLTGAVLREVADSSHDKRGFIVSCRDLAWLDRRMEISVHGGEVNELLVFEVRVDHVLELRWKPLNERWRCR